MTVKVGEREQKLYVLDAADAVEAIIQFLEARFRQRIPRTKETGLSLDSKNHTLTLVVALPAVLTEEERPPSSDQQLH